jgi:hypothetical protein
MNYTEGGPAHWHFSQYISGLGKRAKRTCEELEVGFPQIKVSYQKSVSQLKGRIGRSGLCFTLPDCFCVARVDGYFSVLVLLDISPGATVDCSFLEALSFQFHF